MEVFKGFLSTYILVIAAFTKHAISVSVKHNKTRNVLREKQTEAVRYVWIASSLQVLAILIGLLLFYYHFQQDAGPGEGFFLAMVSAYYIAFAALGLLAAVVSAIYSIPNVFQHVQGLASTYFIISGLITLLHTGALFTIVLLVTEVHPLGFAVILFIAIPVLFIMAGMKGLRERKSNL